MKKKIVCSILVIAMSRATLVGCGFDFDYLKKDMSQYASFDADAFYERISSMNVQESENFVGADDEGLRAMMVLAYAYERLAAKSDPGSTKTEGAPDSNDLIFYSYYVTCTDTDDNGNEITYLLSTAKMKVLPVTSMPKVQFGTGANATDLEELIINSLNGIVFGEGEGEYKAYNSLTGAGTEVKHGSVVYLSYEREYEVTTEEGEIAKKTDVFVSHRVVLDENNPFHAELIAKHTKSDTNKSPISVGRTVTGGITINPITENKSVQAMDEEGNPVYETETVVIDAREETVGFYTSIKIDFVEGSKEYTTVTDTTYDVSTKLDKSYYDGANISVEKQLDVKDRELTYHIYPAFYLEVAELTADNILNIIFGGNITESTLLTLLFGKDYEDALEIEGETERNAKLDELKATYTFINGEKELTIAELATELAAAQKALITADKALTTAEKTYEKAVYLFESEKDNFRGYEEDLAIKLDIVKEKEILYKEAVEYSANADDREAAAELVSATKAELFNAVKAYSEAFAAYKTSYAKVVGDLNTAPITEETAEDAKRITVSISIETADDGAISVRYTTYELLDHAGIGSLENEMNVAELAYRGNKIEAGKGGAVATYVMALDRREDILECFYDAIGRTESGSNVEYAKGLIVEFYKNNLVYRSLEDEYNYKIISEVHKQTIESLISSTVVYTLPKNAVKKQFKNIIKTYKSLWKEGSMPDGTDPERSSYNRQTIRKMKFKEYVTELVMPYVYEQVGMSYDEAESYLESVAEGIVQKQVVIYAVAQALGVKLTNADIQAFKDTKEYQLITLYRYYGITNGPNAIIPEDAFEWGDGIDGLAANDRDFFKDIIIAEHQLSLILDKVCEYEYVCEGGLGNYVSFRNIQYNALNKEEWDALYPEFDEEYEW